MIVKNNNKRTIIVLTLLALLIVAGVAAYYFVKNQDPTKNYKPMYDTSTSKDSTQTDNDSVKDNPSQSNLPTTSEEVPSATEGSIKIVQLNQADGYINAKAETANFSTQTCVYQFSSEGARPITRELEGNCAGISIPQAEFEKIGTYTLVVTAYGSDKKISSTQTLNVQ